MASSRPGVRVVEYTGGSTGSSLAMVCAAKGYRFIALSSDAFRTRKTSNDGSVRRGGADRAERRRQSDAGAFERFKEQIKLLAEEPNTYWTDQFHNVDALQGYMGIGRELLEQAGGRVDVFCGAVGTGGMLRGVAKALKAGGSAARIVALEPSSSAALTGGRGGAHSVEGIATGSVPPHMTDKPYDEALAIDESEARDMAQRLAREEGLLIGTSSGLNIAAAIRIARELGPGKIVTTVAVDTGLKYLAGDLFDGHSSRD